MQDRRLFFSTPPPSPLTLPNQPFKEWVLDEKTIRPTVTHVDRLNSSLYEQVHDDFVIRFVFAPRFQAPDVLVHQSRLLFAEGPFEALAREGFREHAQRKVELAECDNPSTFALIRQFLYGKAIDLNGAEFDKILDAIKSSHRWGLMSLYQVLFEFILKRDLLLDIKHVLAVAGIMSLPEVPSSFTLYFWDSVGRQFRDFSEGDNQSVDHHLPKNAAALASSETDEPNDSVPVEARLCPRFPDLWNMAVNQDMVEYALRAILRFSDMQSRKLNEGLLDVILQYLEPRIDNDSVVCNLILLLNLGNGDYCKQLLSESSTDQLYSTRAIRLMTRTLFMFNSIRSKSRANREASRRLSSDNRISTHLRLRAMKRSRSRSRIFLPELEMDSDLEFV